jgi:hypothetical protein
MSDDQPVNDDADSQEAPGIAQSVGYGLLAAVVCFALAGLAFRGTASSSLEFALQFDTEVSKAESTLWCRDTGTVPPHIDGAGRLYGCIMGRAGTAKLFINEDGSRPGTVENVKVMWNDWRRDLGHGAHADRREALQMVSAFARWYAPSIEDELASVFQGEVARSYIVGQYRITYRLDRGPGIDERLLTLAPK